MAEINRRAAGKSIEEREKIEEEVLGKVQVPKIPIAKVADHIEHIRDVAGIEHVGIGGDYDGNYAVAGRAVGRLRCIRTCSPS